MMNLDTAIVIKLDILLFYQATTTFMRTHYTQVETTHKLLVEINIG